MRQGKARDCIQYLLFSFCRVVFLMIFIIDVVGKCRELVQRTEKLMRSEFYEAVTKEEKMAVS